MVLSVMVGTWCLMVGILCPYLLRMSRGKWKGAGQPRPPGSLLLGSATLRPRRAGLIGGPLVARLRVPATLRRHGAALLGGHCGKACLLTFRLVHMRTPGIK